MGQVPKRTNGPQRTITGTGVTNYHPPQPLPAAPAEFKLTHHRPPRAQCRTGEHPDESCLRGDVELPDPRYPTTPGVTGFSGRWRYAVRTVSATSTTTWRMEASSDVDSSASGSSTTRTQRMARTSQWRDSEVWLRGIASTRSPRLGGASESKRATTLFASMSISTMCVTVLQWSAADSFCYFHWPGESAFEMSSRYGRPLSITSTSCLTTSPGTVIRPDSRRTRQRAINTGMIPMCG
jgi:hypothetical protein